ncbi:hypothetical protein PR003_g23855 [Phytophthora rubi]|uniref:Reverse transcriptase/retrotransposon-derived protein RNase H-like domain-containing protein n=1 Tax=Phytophthora rubi TaxID=129364 RepID=A0A6A4CSN5_9STRA|nr:hypothetical protein PR003_g23855 [Phytophthora rubi]
MGGAKPHDEGTARRVRFAVDEHGGVCAGTTASPVAGRKTAVDGDDATRRVVIDLACASVVQTKEEQAEVVAQQLDAWMVQFGADVAPDEVVVSAKKRDEEDEGGSPESVQQAMAMETSRRDPAKANVLRVKAAEVLQRAAQAEVEARQLHRRQKRKLREHERRERRAARASRESEQVVEVVRAAVVPDKGHDELIVEAAMLVTSTGPVVTPASDEFVRVSRTRRRYEKLARKARAREDRKLREWLATQHYPEGTYMAFADTKRRHGKRGPRLMSIEEASVIGFSPPSTTMVVAKVARQKLPKRSYQYESGRVYAASSAPAVDSLPTARVQAGSEWKDIKLDTGAQFCVAGESWKKLGRRLSSLPPVDYVEGFTGAVAKVEGVWRFEFTTQYGQMMPVDALVVEGAADEFLLGEDWMLQNGVKIDSTSCEMKWYDGGDKKVVPFSCMTTDEEAERTVQVRLVRKQRVQTQTCRQMELAVAAPEGTVGLFMPASGAEPHLMLAPTLTTVHDGKVVVSIMNLVGRTSKLPSREKLGTCTPTNEDMPIMEVTGEFDQARVKQWLETQLHDENAPLSNEGELKLGKRTRSFYYGCYDTILNYLSLVTGVPLRRRWSVAQHVVQLAAVLERLAGAGLSLKASKCSFASEKWNYLGHELDGAGVRPMSSLVESVKNFPTPTDVTEVKRFVHMAGYYRRFVSDFAAKAAPMTKLLRKGVVWRWGDSQKEAFECLKKA